MKALMSLFTFFFFIQLSFAANNCTGRFTPFEMLKVGVGKTWITLRAKSESRVCESVYGKIHCEEWKVNEHVTPFIKKLSLELVSSDRSVYTRGTHYRDTTGYFTWMSNKTLLNLTVKKDISVRGECRQWGASGGVGYGGCRSWGTRTVSQTIGDFNGRVSEDCVYLIGPTSKSERTYFSQDTFTFNETRKILASE